MSPKESTKRLPERMPRELSNIPASTNSLTAFAFAPGVLKTTMPRFVYSATGTLFTPAPARATAFTDSGIASSCSFWLRNNTASG